MPRQPFLRSHALRAHQSLRIIGLDYYIAVPCLHVAQAIIALWFVRQWRRIAGLFLAYNLLLLPTVLLLEQHYVVDIIGGFLVAAAAISIVENIQKRGEIQNQEIFP